MVNNSAVPVCLAVNFTRDRIFFVIEYDRNENPLAPLLPVLEPNLLLVMEQVLRPRNRICAHPI